jgi:hypothetical protein
MRAHERTDRAGGRGQHGNGDGAFDQRRRARERELRERDHIAIGGDPLRGLRDQPVVRSKVACIDGVEGAFCEHRPHFDTRGEFRRHRCERRRK